MMKTFDLVAGKLLRTCKQYGEFGDPIKISMDQSYSYLLCSYTKKSICMYDSRSGEMVAQAVGHGQLITAAIFLPDGKRSYLQEPKEMSPLVINEALCDTDNSNHHDCETSTSENSSDSEDGKDSPDTNETHTFSTGKGKQWYFCRFHFLQIFCKPTLCCILN